MKNSVSSGSIYNAGLFNRGRVTWEIVNEAIEQFGTLPSEYDDWVHINKYQWANNNNNNV